MSATDTPASGGLADRPDPLVAMWARAIEMGARARYAEAETLTTALTSAAGRWASLGLSLRASHLRQVGDTLEAMRLDTAALRLACDAESQADALTGLAADAVASGDPDRAGGWHDQAASDAAQGWRTLTRWHWVGAEHALLCGDRSAAQVHGRNALAACAGRSLRHEMKSRIVLAAASCQVTLLPEVSPVLRSEGWLTLEWPLALVAAAHAEQVDGAWLAEAWAAGREATYAIERALTDRVVPVWRAHPGVVRLREAGPVIKG